MRHVPQRAAAADLRAEADTLRLGLIASPGVADDVARRGAARLPDALRERVSAGVHWEVPVVTDELGADRATTGSEIVDRARARMLREGFDLAVCLTDLPLRIGRRPVVADASATHGVGLICLPALGARNLAPRATDAIVRLVDGLMGERMLPGRREGAARRGRVQERLADRAASVHRMVPDDEDVDLRFVSAVLRGNLRLLVGMVRANRPWRLAPGLTKALAAALGAVAFAIVTSDIWRIAAALGWPQLAVLTAASILATVITLIAVHGLWERAARRAREQALLFNVVTGLTIALGILWLYVVLFAVALASAALLLSGGVLKQSVGHAASAGVYLKLAWLTASLATVGGALVAALEDDHVVRQAAYGYRPDHETRADG